MGFREEDAKYAELMDSWKVILYRAHHPGKGVLIDEVDNLMLASYRLQRHIRRYLTSASVEASRNYYVKDVPLLPDAVKDVKATVLSKNGIISLFSEMEKIESVSRACFRWLRENEKLIKTTTSALTLCRRAD